MTNRNTSADSFRSYSPDARRTVSRVLVSAGDGSVVHERKTENCVLISADISAEDEASFWERVNKTETCWLWTRGNAPYGVFNIKGKAWAAYRVAYALEHGATPSTGDLDHLCEVTRCVRPSHLEAVTHQENIRRAVGRAVCVRGHAKEVGRKCRECNNFHQRAFRARQAVSE